MKTLIFLSIFLPSIELILARPQQGQIEPAYLRDYYTRGSVADATPIFEQSTSFQPSSPQQLNGGQQIRLRDPVQDQVKVKSDDRKKRTLNYEHVLVSQKPTN